jgi:IS5 family transposase
MDQVVPWQLLIDLIESRVAGHSGRELLNLIEMAKAHIRAKGEHPFRIVKQQFGFQKKRLRGMAKNRCKVHLLAAVANLFMARHLLLEPI